MRKMFFLMVMAISLLPHFANANRKLQTSHSLSDREKVDLDHRSLDIPKGYLKNLRWDPLLDTLGPEGSTISWRSSNPRYLSDEGRLLKRSSRGRKKVSVMMTATLSLGSIAREKSFKVNIAYEEPAYSGYLFAYFEGSGPAELQEQLRFGLSSDAKSWLAMNDNLPIIPSAEISKTGGIRDPHILRGEDEKTFYMVATDMYTHKNGWGYNPGIVMLRSKDLVNWKHNIIDLEKTYPENFANIQWVWAPQTIYDPEADKYLIYFTVKFKDDPKLDFYYAYSNKNFTGFEGVPKLMFRTKYGAIDGDILYRNGIYHFFYKGNTKDENGKEIRNGIQQATSRTLRGPWKENFVYVDSYSSKGIPVEGSGIFKLNNLDEYVLMYDLYTNLRYEFQRSADLFNFSQVPETFNKNFNPRHGTVISITKQDALRLNKKWKSVPAELIK